MNIFKDRKRLAITLRVVAKIWSILVIAFLLFMFVGEVVYPHGGEGFVDITEIIAMIFFPFGIVGGMVISWKWERIGAIMTIISLFIFYILILIPRTALRGIPMSLLIAGPGFLFLISSFLSPKEKKS